MPKPKKQVDFQGYVSVSLQEEDFEAIEKAVTLHDDILIQLQSVVYDGYKFSSSYEAENKRFKSSLMYMGTNKRYAGWMLSGESDTFLASLAVLLYKHVVRLGADWTLFCTENASAQRFR
jgi:hypothetical protein